MTNPAPELPSLPSMGIPVIGALRANQIAGMTPPFPMLRLDRETTAPVFLTGGLDVTHVDFDVNPTLDQLPYPIIVIHASRYEEDTGFNDAAMILGPSQSNGDLTMWLILFSERGPDGGRALMHPLTAHFLPDSTLISFGINLWADSAAKRWPGGQEAFLEVGKQFVVDHGLLAIKVLTVINSGRISYEPAPIGPQLLRRWARKPQQKVDYRVLVMPDGARTVGRSLPVVGDPRGTALHTVRGHPVTYTADAPLFGKYVGTFWRKPTVRGDRKYGEVVKDYQLPEETPIED